MKKPKAFCCYLDAIDIVEVLTDEEAGRLWKNLFRFANYGELPSDEEKGISIAFLMMSKQISRDFEKYNNRIESASKGGAPKGNQNAKKDD
ncbi:MAG: DUF6291 domain-containing protein [Ruminococcus sp.]|jgi:hypothetical protein|nr:DUF6291 domain-containing protein [Ruminococcus sp.]